MATSRGNCTRKPHALAIPVPLQGHMHPLLEFSKKLISAGFMVTFANIEANHQKIKSSHDGIHNEGRIDSRDLHMVSLEEGFPADLGDTGGALLSQCVSPAMKASVERLVARLQSGEHPVTLLVCDFRLSFVHDVAESVGIPSVALWTQSAASFACNLFTAQGWLHLPPDDSTPITCIHGVPPFRRSEGSGFTIALVPNGGEVAWSPFRHIEKPTWIVLNTFMELEATTLETLQDRLGFRLLTVGPMVNAASFSVSKGLTGMSSTAMADSLLRWLDGLPPASVLYIAFGTVAVLPEQLLEEFVEGLEESGQRILWVFRPDLCRDPEKYTVKSLSRRFRNQGMVVPWAPQLQILHHPSVGGFLSHCGWNSTLEAIAAGVPMLAWPGFVDQPLNARCLENQWGVACRWQGDKPKASRAWASPSGREVDDNGETEKLVSRAEVSKKVREFMEGERRGREMRKKAISLREAAKRALESGGSSERDFAVLLDGYAELQK